jgi:hypothetical protein
MSYDAVQVSSPFVSGVAESVAYLPQRNCVASCFRGGSSMVPGATSCLAEELPLLSLCETQGCSKTERNFQVIRIPTTFKNSTSMASGAS